MENLKQASGENLSTATAPKICFKKKSPKNLNSFSLQFIFFLEQPFYENYSTLDSRTNTAISKFKSQH